MQLPHRLEFRSSLYMAVALSVLHLIALGCLMPLPFPLLFKALLAVALMTSLGIVSRRYAFLAGAASIRELILKDDGMLEGVQLNGRRFEARVSGQSSVLPGLLVLLIAVHNEHRLLPLVVLPDSLSKEDGRILRTWLKWKST